MSAPTPHDHAKVLRRRARWLAKRVDAAKTNGFILTHDVAEHDALEWALSVLEQWVDLGPKGDDE